MGRRQVNSKILSLWGIVMAENEHAAGDNVDINSQLSEVLLQLRNQREEVQSLKEELQGSAFNVAAEVKKLKTGKDLI